VIKNRLSAILGERRLKMSDVARATQLARTTVFNFYHDRSKRIDYPVLDKLCAFLNCQPGDLLVYVPEDAQNGR
jgi:putative transcriptional regulator